MFLIDTNIWLEQLLEQQRYGETKRLLQTVPSELLFISSFSLYSIGIILSSREKHELYDEFIEDLFLKGNVNILIPDTIKLKEINHLCSITNLDFDDSFQKILADIHSLKIVSFDQDFLKEGIQVFNPEQAVQSFLKSQLL